MNLGHNISTREQGGKLFAQSVEVAYLILIIQKESGRDLVVSSYIQHFNEKEQSNHTSE